MEHVLRQCLIALRLADQAGLGEQDRMAVYYTALLVNVGCHADAHEQAKWFGDDITLKSGKYAARVGQRARRAGDHAAGRRGQPAAAPVPGRAGVRLLRAPRARRDDLPAREAGPDAGRAARAARRGARGGRRSVRAVGRAGLAGRAESRRDTGRGQDRAARGVHGGGAPRRRRRRRHGAGPPAGRTAVRSGSGRAAVRWRRGDLRRPGLGPGLADGDRLRARAGRRAVGRTSSTARWRPSRTSWT